MALPSLYDRWLDPLLGGAIPPETEATCHDCAMCRPDEGPAHAAGSYFTPSTKCCTYLPVLPNFRVGQILADGDPTAAPGRSTVEARIDRGEMVRPLGLGVPPAYSLQYDQAALDFGTSRALLCPHFLADGRCGIWRYRNGVCTTWFCKHVRGAVGLHFWQAIERLLSAVERMLACWCLLDEDFGAAAFAPLSPARSADPWRPLDSNLAGTLEPVAYREMWGQWAGQERDFYRACCAKVEGLTWPDIVRIGGPDVTAAAQLARAAYQTLVDPSLPEALTVGPFRVIGTDDRGAQVEGYHGSDPLYLSRDLMDVLPHFNGRPTLETLRSIEAQHRVKLERDLIGKLADFEILVPHNDDRGRQSTRHNETAPKRARP